MYQLRKAKYSTILIQSMILTFTAIETRVRNSNKLFYSATLSLHFYSVVRFKLHARLRTQELCGKVDDVHHVESRLWRDQ